MIVLENLTIVQHVQVFVRIVLVQNEMRPLTIV